ncbi:exodeoxyribonuclease VII small subunit [Ornithinimicrobium sp. Y1847]|uniref:exodeoxyribonuclease VII small subunit n=1 Tax=Ornithinimicrobium sp. Y1847 TaxID=3405419 RepID=UPI003B67AEE9
MSQTPEDLTPVAELTYEQARDELVALVARIESGQVPLEQAMLLWQRGEELAAHCQTKLDAAQATLDGSAGPEAVDENAAESDGEGNDLESDVDDSTTAE